MGGLNNPNGNLSDGDLVIQLCHYGANTRPSILATLALDLVPDTHQAYAERVLVYVMTSPQAIETEPQRHWRDVSS